MERHSQIEFYESYLYNYFRIKAAQYGVFLENPNFYTSFFKNVEGLEERDLDSCLKLDIRGTYFHAVETIFELLFAIEDDNELDIWKKLTNSDYTTHNRRIRSVAKGQDPILSTTIKRTKPDESPIEYEFLEYAFFCGHSVDGSEDEMKKNLDFIKRFIQLIADEFSERSEYNAHKHGLRLFPVVKSLQAVSESDKSIRLDLNLSDSFTFLEAIDKENIDKTTYHTRTFDPARDIRMVGICGNLISNFITARKAIFITAKPTQLYSWAHLNIEEITRPNIQVKDFKFSITPVYNEDLPVEGDSNKT